MVVEKNQRRLLYVVEAMGGGVFTYINNLANELCEKYDVYIAYSVRSQTPDNFEDFFNKKIHLIEVKNFKREIDLFSDIRAMVELRHIEKIIDPDIIHLHSSKAGALGRLIFSYKHKPLFYTPHGYSFLSSNSKFKNKLYKCIESSLAKFKCTTISCSLGEHQETLKMTSRAFLVNNGININELENMLKNNIRHVEPQNRLTVFTLGRITKQKNPYLFNQIANLMPDVKFVWIGDGELRDVLTAENIEIKGWLSRKKALSIAYNADVFLLTSGWEGLPIALLEAMYMKKLCVVSNAVGNRDVIENNVSGYVCETVTQYVKAILAQRSVMIESAHEKVISEYNTSIMSKKYEEIYANSLSQYKD